MFENLVLHDFDGDGRPELYTNGERKRLYRFVKDAKGQPALEPAVSRFGEGESSGSGYAIGDITGDGRDDILTPVGFYEQPKEKGDIFTKQWRFHRRPISTALASFRLSLRRGETDRQRAQRHHLGRRAQLRHLLARARRTEARWNHDLDATPHRQVVVAGHVLVWTDIDGTANRN